VLIWFLGGTFVGAMVAMVAIGLARSSRLAEIEAEGYCWGYRQGLAAAEEERNKDYALGRD
jgi:hypothetical protein